MASSWYDSWMEKKRKYARTDETQMNKDRFFSMTIGTGLPDLVQKSTFSFTGVREGADRFAGKRFDGEASMARIYTRLGNPTTEYVEKLCVKLEGDHILQAAKAAGEDLPVLGGMVFSSGMAAITMCLQALMKKDCEILCADVVYSSTTGYLKDMESRFGIKTHFIDMTDMDLVAKTLDENPKIVAVFCETPDNPTLKVTDIAAVSELAEKHEVPLIVDNTFATPYLQQPLRLGADMVVQSMTKYFNGRSVVVGGSVVGPHEFIRKQLFPMAKDIGACPSPFDSWLNAMNVQTLGHRMEQHCATAKKIAAFLEKHPKVTAVYFPGLESHPQHELVKRQMRHPGAMISFELENGFEAAQKLMDYFAGHDTPMELAVSLGCAVSYIQHPASMTHASVAKEQRLGAGITDELVRISVGLEGEETLLHHLEKGLEKAYA